MKISELFTESGRADWDPNMQGYQGDYGGEKNWGRKDREDDEHHHLDAKPEQKLWYVRVNGVVEKKDGAPLSYPDKESARKAGLIIHAKDTTQKVIVTLDSKDD